jgi:RNA polymerase sigma-70 factor (ECF subfamily)
MTAVRRRAQQDGARPDALLLGLAHAGDRDALGELYDRYAQAVFAFARRLASAADAEDVVQATFMRIADIAGSYDDRALSARAWIFGVAYRVLAERRRASRRFADAIRSYTDAVGGAVATSVKDATDIERALGALSEPKRTVLILTQVHGFSCEEVARMLDLPIGTVWTRLHHARRELRAHLEETP